MDGYWNFTTQTCDEHQGPGIYDPDSPIVIDIEGNGFALTNAANGVALTLTATAPWRNFRGRPLSPMMPGSF